MSQNFIAVDREQDLLLPPSLREWLPDGHFAWFVLDAVGQMDLSGFYAAYRQDGHGRAAHEPTLMVALLLYGYARGLRSSRRIERACVEDVSFRVVAANQAPDHTTIARFRQRHEAHSRACLATCSSCARRLVWSSSGWSRSTGRGCTPTLVVTRTPSTRRSRRRSWPRPMRSIARRMSASATARAWTCCRRVSHPGRPQGPAARGKPPARGAPRTAGAADPEVAP